MFSEKNALTPGMIEAKGWIAVEAAFDEDDLYNLKQKKAVSDVVLLLDSVKGHNQFFELKNLNGNFTLYIGLSHNHDNGYGEMLYKLMEDICTAAPGSYGMLHVRLPEDELSWNHFAIWKIARGMLTVEEDLLFSPCRPVIED